jgi:outer membrane protein assembly factor BamB
MSCRAARCFHAAIAALLVCLPIASAADWPMLGRTPARNPVSPESGAPLDWQPGEFNRETGSWIAKGAHNVKWIAKLGSQTYGTPVVADGHVYVGTNNAAAYLDRYPKNVDLGCLLCFRESDGEFLWQYSAEKLPTGRAHDWPRQGLGSSPLVEGERMWFVSNRWEVICADTQSFRDGENDGPFVDEPVEAPNEADVLWKFDLMNELGVQPHPAGMGPDRRCSIAAHENRIYVITGNGVTENHVQIPAPDAPSLVCLDKDTGEVLWTDNSPGNNILHTQIASPLVAEIQGRAQVIVPQGDGWIRAFDALSGELIWKFDINFKESRWILGGRGSRNNILATPVLYENFVYIASGQESEHGDGMARLVCIDPTTSGDISSELAVDADGKVIPHQRFQAVDPSQGQKTIANPNSGLVWEFGAKTKEEQQNQEFEEQLHRTRSSVAVQDGLVIVADGAGLVHCFDAKTGQRHWAYDVLAACIAAPLIADGKIYVVDEDGDAAIFRLSHDPDVAMKPVAKMYEPIAEINMGTSIYCSPIFANGVLYLATRSQLFAIQETGDEQQERQAVAPPAVDMGEWKQWRGPDRANKSPETGLLKEWPEGGPPLVWRVDGLGQGIASVSIADGHIFTSTYSEGTEFMVALDQRTGRLVWVTPIGAAVPESPRMRWLSQRTATLDEDRLYVLSAEGVLFCLDIQDGNPRWRKSYIDDFQGKSEIFGFCDYPLVDGDKLICTPGGPETTVVALDKLTGELSWKYAADTVQGHRGDKSYAATIVSEAAGVRQYIIYAGDSVLGISADDGRLLWRRDRPRTYRFESITPLVSGDSLLCATVPDAVLLTFERDGESIRVNEEYAARMRVDLFQDNLILVNEHVYAISRGIFSCTNLKSGELTWETRIRGASGATTYADGRLYLRHSDGQVRLVEPSPQEYIERGLFTLQNHRETQGATTPVVAGGHLYLRDDDRLFAYDIRRTALDGPRPESKTISIGFPQAPAAAQGLSRQVTRPGLRSVFVPTPQDIVERMLELADVKNDDLVYDLGSGDGRIVVTAAKKYGSRAVGVEIDAELVDVSRAKASEEGVGELVTIAQQDIFATDLSTADVVAVYLLPLQLEKLIPQLERLPPGARIVSHQFEIPGIKADRTVRVTSDEDGAEHAIYLWTAPLKP